MRKVENGGSDRVVYELSIPDADTPSGVGRQLK